MSLDWTNCFDCIHYEGCTEKETRNGCCFGDSIEDHIILKPRIKLRKDRAEDWKPSEFPLHTGEHSQ